MTSYLTPADAANYGVPSATQAQIQAASLLIDAYCGRSRWGLTWVADGAGSPCYMSGAVADMTWMLNSAITAGANVTIQLQTAPMNPDAVGNVLVLDRLNSTLTESCVITTVNSPTVGCVTLDNVQFNHPITNGPVLIENGLLCLEEKFLPDNRSITRLTQWPIVGIKSALGRYSYGRRSTQVMGSFIDADLLTIVQSFGGPPAWQPMPVAGIAFNQSTGELWLPAGTLLAYYTDARFFYVAGFSAANVPPQIKLACATIIQNVMSSANMSSMNKLIKTGDTSIERFADTAIDTATKMSLNPFRAIGYV